MDDAKKVWSDILLAREDRKRHADWMNEVMALGLPTYRRIDVARNASDRADDQDDLFDNELQVVLEDFSSDMISTFTPRYERWVDMQPATALSEGQTKQIADQSKAIEDLIFGEIEKSNYWEAAQECFQFWGVSAMGVAVSDMGPLKPIFFQPIEIADLLMKRGPDGTLYGKWREMAMTQGDLLSMWPDVFPADSIPQSQRKKPCLVVEGCDRDTTVPGEERWVYRIFVDGKEKVAMSYEGQGSCPIIACRFRHQADSAWGPGPTHKAVPPARALDQLAYLSLKALGKNVDPPVSYEEDGVSNFEGGIQDGMAYPRASGTSAPEAMLPEVRFDAAFFKEEELRKAIKRALYQDRPEQPGQTPPTLGQWMDEKAWNTRRRELPRDRCVREWVLPIIERVAYILKQRGQLPELKLRDGTIVSLKPISPMSKAKDMEDMQVSNQVLGMATSVGAAAAQGVPVDVRATVERLQATAKERHIVLKTAEQIQADAAAQAAAAAGIQGAIGGA